MSQQKSNQRWFRRFLTALVLLLSTAWLASDALANVVGTGTQNFNPLTDGLDYVTVHSSKTLEPGIVNLGGFYNHAVNSLPYVDSTLQSHTKLNDTLVSSDSTAYSRHTTNIESISCRSR